MEGKITLEGMEFFAHHGFYKEEQKIGNKFAVDIMIVTDLSDAAEHDALEETINYETLYKIIRHVMNEPTKLLEHLGKRIIDTVFNEFQQVSAIIAYQLQETTWYLPESFGVIERIQTN